MAAPAASVATSSAAAAAAAALNPNPAPLPATPIDNSSTGIQNNINQTCEGPPPENCLFVECSDGEVVQVDKDVVSKMSLAIRKKLETFSGDTPILLDNITGRALHKVMEYCIVHTSPENKGLDLKPWDEKFVRLDPGTLCELASAAYHLEIKPLVDLTCQAIAQLLKGKSPAEIRRTFNILYDFNPEDDAPPPTMRDKLRNKLVNPKRKEKLGKAVSAPATHEDSRSVDELLAFLGEASSSTATPSAASPSNSPIGSVAQPTAAKGSKAAKRARQKERRKMRASDETGTSNASPTASVRTSLSTSGGASTKNGDDDGGSSDEPASASPSSAAHASDDEAFELPAASSARSPRSPKQPQPPAPANGKKASLKLPAAPPLKKEPGRTAVPATTSAASPSARPSFMKAIEDAMLQGNQDADFDPEDDEDEEDPELKAAQDREIEEFRARLESINRDTRPRIALPAKMSLEGLLGPQKDKNTSNK